MAEAALSHCEEVVLVMARAMPHKPIEGAPFLQREEWLRAISANHECLSAALTDGGLFIEMARETRVATGAERVLLICGRDAAERIIGWDYCAGDSIEKQLEEYELLVAPRGGPYIPPPHLGARIHALEMPSGWEDVSSTGVRLLQKAGHEWRHLVPEEILEGYS